MEPVTLSGLLAADEEKVRGGLRADAGVDHSRKQSVERLRDELGKILLRYNAAAAQEPSRQALADGMTAAAGEMLELLMAGVAKREISRRRLRSGAVIALLIAVIFGLTAALLVRENFLVGCALMAAAALSAFASGRLWYGEREVRVHAELDPEIVWRTLRRSLETMDRKSEEFLAQERLRQQEAKEEQTSSTIQALDPETLALIGSLLEAAYAENGEFALRQLRQIQPWLRRRGVETRDYSPESAELFELLPTRKNSATQRPALLYGEKLLMAGRATEHVEGP